MSEEAKLARVDKGINKWRLFIGGELFSIYDEAEAAHVDAMMVNSHVSRLLAAEREKVEQERFGYHLGVARKDAAVRALEMAAKDACAYCDMAWQFEVTDHGVYHRVPPENAPTVYLNMPCSAGKIRALASRVEKGEEKI